MNVRPLIAVACALAVGVPAVAAVSVSASVDDCVTASTETAPLFETPSTALTAPAVTSHATGVPTVAVQSFDDRHDAATVRVDVPALAVATDVVSVVVPTSAISTATATCDGRTAEQTVAAAASGQAAQDRTASVTRVVSAIATATGADPSAAVAAAQEAALADALDVAEQAATDELLAQSTEDVVRDAQEDGGEDAELAARLEALRAAVAQVWRKSSSALAALFRSPTDEPTEPTEPPVTETPTPDPTLPEPTPSVPPVTVTPTPTLPPVTVTPTPTPTVPPVTVTPTPTPTVPPVTVSPTPTPTPTVPPVTVTPTPTPTVPPVTVSPTPTPTVPPVTPTPTPTPTPSPSNPPSDGNALLIKHGWDIPSPSFVANNAAEIDQLPFDGITMSLPGLGDEIHSQTPVTRAQVDSALNPVANVTFQNVKNNFVTVYAAPAGDVFGDWTVPTANFGNLAAAARDAGFAGVLFDNEEYFGDAMRYPENCVGYTVEQCRAQALLRGRQVMDAMRASWSDVRVMTTFGAWISDPATARNLPGVRYNDIAWANEISGSFVAGLVTSSVGTASRVIDGGEIYTARTPEQFDVVSDWQRPGMAAESTILPESLKAVYAQTIDAAFAVYDRPWIGVPMDVDIWETTIANALRGDNEYVWLYTEQYDWFGVGHPTADVPAAWVDAVRDAR